MRLPETWIQTTVGAVVADVQPGFAQKPGEEDEGTTPQIRTHNVTPDGKISLEGIKHITASERELARYSLAAGDVVFNNTNSEEWVGKTAVFDKGGDFVFSNHMTRLRVREDLVCSKYLAAYLQSLWSMGYSKTRAKRWVSQAGIESDTLASFKIPLPTIPEQQRIVDVLRQADLVNDLASKARRLLDSLAMQRFAELFGHPAENPKGFETAAFASFGTLDRGVSKHRPRDAGHLFGGPYPFIQTGDVSNAGDWLSTYRETYSEAGLAQSRLWPKGTLCITIAANIAKAALLEFDACFPDSVVGFTPFEGVSNEYVLYCLRFYQEYFEHRAPKSAQMNINLDTLRTLRMPRPPEALQIEFSRFVNEMRELTRVTTKQAYRRGGLAAELTVAAFTGDLSAGWREQNRDRVATAAAHRDASLRVRGTKINIGANAIAAPVVEVVRTARPARHWLLGELSDFQRQVLAVFTAHCQVTGEPLLVEDPDVFARFCDDALVAERLKAFGTSHGNRIRRSLSQLSALGLIAKVTLPKVDPESGERDYLKAFRPLRPEEFTRLGDVQALRKALSPDADGESS
ncbi:restriction endonuclease subunit S [Roseateles sp. NT4]|uniref:restriction endonuclease subunit S n=1 Tax=Roseateles sp. NT4 TaxID=3453715 RepID=UPI003EE9BD04